VRYRRCACGVVSVELVSIELGSVGLATLDRRAAAAAATVREPTVPR
jgi:hypothetical protein